MNENMSIPIIGLAIASVSSLPNTINATGPAAANLGLAGNLTTSSKEGISTLMDSAILIQKGDLPTEPSVDKQGSND